MKDLWMDPVVLGAGGVIVVGFVLLVLAVRALRKPSTTPPVKDFDFPSLRTKEPLSVVSPDSNPFASNTVVPSPAPVANKDVLEKVDLISQRLVDMQMLLNKQVTASARVGGSAPALSPEMLDKLLTIASTVAQQIDVLQKALGGAPAPTPAAPPAMTPADATPPLAAPPRSAPSMTPVSQVIGSSAKPTSPPANP